MDKPRSAIAQSITIDHPRLNIAPSAPIEKPQLALPRPAGNVTSKTSIGQLIERGRVGVSAGVAFLVNRDALANAPGDTLALRTGRAYENELRTGLRVLLVALVLGGGWMALMPLAYFIAHLLYGIGLGMTPVFVRRFSRKRDDHRMERAEALPQASES